MVSSRAALLVLLVVSSGGVARAAAAASPLPVERTSFTGHLAGGGIVRVKNLLGDVRARRANLDEVVEVQGTLQPFEGARLRVDARETAAGIEIEAILEGHAGPDAPARVDLVVFVPDGARLEVEASAGLVEAKKVRGDVSASTGSGEIRVTGGFGHLDLHTVRGPILATLDPFVPGKSRRLGSLTGDVVVYLPEGVEVDVSAATSGELTTDFSLQVEHVRDAEPTKRATAALGGEARRDSPLVIETRQGQVKLLRIQKVFQTTHPGSGTDAPDPGASSSAPPAAQGVP